MKVVLKRMDNKPELMEIDDLNTFCKGQFFEEPHRDGRLLLPVSDPFAEHSYYMYIGCQMQGNFGDEHFVLYRPNEMIEEMKAQMIYGNVVFVKKSADEFGNIIDMDEEELEAISEAFFDHAKWGVGKIEIMDFNKALAGLSSSSLF